MTQNQSSNHSDTTMATLLFSIVIIFLVCHSPKLVLNIYEGIQMVRDDEPNFWPEWANVLSMVSHLLLAINSSINFVIYTARDQKFRQALLLLFRCKKKPQKTANIALKSMSMSTEMTREDTMSEVVL